MSSVVGRALEAAKQLIGGDDVGPRAMNEALAELDTCEWSQPWQRSLRRCRQTCDGSAADCRQAGKQPPGPNVTCQPQLYALAQWIAGDPAVADSPVGEAMTKTALEPSQLPGACALKSDDNHCSAEDDPDYRNIHLLTCGV